MFSQFGFTEILLVMVVILLLFGAKRIPEIAGSFGKGIKEFKRSLSDVDRAIQEPGRDDRLEAREHRIDNRLRPNETPAPAPRAADEERPEPKRLLS